MLRISGFTLGGPDEQADVRLAPVSRFTHDDILMPSVPYGHGNRADTRNFLALIDAMDLHGKRVADIGAGIGTLAIAATLRGANVTVFEADAHTLATLTQNVALNGHDVEIRGAFPDDWDGRPFDVAFCNLGPHVPPHEVSPEIYVTSDNDGTDAVRLPKEHKRPLLLPEARKLAINKRIYAKNLEAAREAALGQKGEVEQILRARVLQELKASLEDADYQVELTQDGIRVAGLDAIELQEYADHISNEVRSRLSDWITSVERTHAKAQAAVAAKPEDAEQVAMLLERVNEKKIDRRGYLRLVGKATGTHWSDVTVNETTLSCGCMHEQWFSDGHLDGTWDLPKTIRHHRVLRQCDYHPGAGRAAWRLAHEQDDVLDQVRQQHPTVAPTLEPGRLRLAVPQAQHADALALARLIFGDQPYYAITAQ